MSGVPQGSVLGPILFAVFINTLDLPIRDKVDFLSKFADDTKVGKKVSNSSDCEIMQQIINRLFDWSKQWQMEFNVSKCKLVHFGKSNDCHPYMMNNQPLVKSNKEKDIGVIISDDAKPSTQCAAAAKKANITLGRMARAVSFRDKRVWLRLYQVYVRPQLEYAIQAWRPWLAKDIKMLEDVQRRAVRMTSGLTGTCYEDRLEEVGMTSLEERRARGDAIQVWKILSQYDDIEESTWFNRCNDIASRDTRQSSNTLNLQHKGFKYDFRKHSFSVRSTRHWNSLPTSVRESKTLRQFKSAYDVHSKNVQRQT